MRGRNGEVGEAELGDEHGRHAVEAVQRSSWTACRVAAGSNAGAGMTIVAPSMVHEVAITIPKQW